MWRSVYLDHRGVAAVEVGSEASNVKADAASNGNDGFLAPAKPLFFTTPDESSDCYLSWC